MFLFWMKADCAYAGFIVEGIISARDKNMCWWLFRSVRCSKDDAINLEKMATEKMSWAGCSGRLLFFFGEGCHNALAPSAPTSSWESIRTAMGRIANVFSSASKSDMFTRQPIPNDTLDHIFDVPIPVTRTTLSKTLQQIEQEAFHATRMASLLQSSFLTYSKWGNRVNVLGPK